MFHLGDILSVITHKNVSPRLMIGVLEVVEFMMGKRINPAESVIFYSDRCRIGLLEQHPMLGGVDASRVNEKNWKRWLSVQVRKYGKELPVRAM